MARFKACSKNLGTELGYNKGKEIYPRTICEKDVGLCLYNNHFCLIWNSQGVSFNQAKQELKTNFKKVDTFKTENKVESRFKYESLPKKLNLN